MGELSYVKLGESEIAEGLKGAAGWRVDGGLLVKDFQFEAYLSGVAFAGAVGYVAEALDHHPDIRLGYRNVTISVNTHSVGGISPYDFELARRIDALRPEQPSANPTT